MRALATERGAFKFGYSREGVERVSAEELRSRGALAKAEQLGVPAIVTGLSRGQFFETRLVPGMFESDRFDPAAIEMLRAVPDSSPGYAAARAALARVYLEHKKDREAYAECYAEMAEREMLRISDECAKRWPGTRVAIAHRTGHLEIGDIAVIVVAVAPHRAG